MAAARHQWPAAARHLDRCRRVRERMAEVARVLTDAGPLAAGLGTMCWGAVTWRCTSGEPALQQLRAAEAAGVHDAELDYALGRVLGELYMEGMDRARKSGDKSFKSADAPSYSVSICSPHLQYFAAAVARPASRRATPKP